MFSVFKKTPNLEQTPRDAFDTAARDAIGVIERIDKATDALVEAIPLIREMMALPLPEAVRDAAARSVTEWVASSHQARFAEIFQESTQGFRRLRDGMLEAACKFRVLN